MACLLCLDVSSHMLDIPKKQKHKNLDNDTPIRPAFKFAKKGLILLSEGIKKYNPNILLELATFSDTFKFHTFLTHSTNNLILTLKTFSEFKGVFNLKNFYDSINNYLSEKSDNINIIIVTLNKYDFDDINKIKNISNLRIFYIYLTEDIDKFVHYNKNEFFNYHICPFNTKKINFIFKNIMCNICNLTMFKINCADFKKSTGFLYPSIPLDLTKSWLSKNDCLIFETLGFLDQEDLVYCTTEYKYNIFIDSRNQIKDDSINILNFLKNCLRRQRSTCLVSLGTGFYGIILSLRINKQDHFVFIVPKCDLPWLGSWSALGPLSSTCVNPYEIDEQGLESSPFPLIEGFECSYYENDNNYLLTKPNFEADVSSLLMSLKLHGYDLSCFAYNYDKFKRLCILYGMSGLIVSVKKMLIEQISQFSAQDQPLILEYLKKED